MFVVFVVLLVFLIPVPVEGLVGADVSAEGLLWTSGWSETVSRSSTFEGVSAGR